MMQKNKFTILLLIWAVALTPLTVFARTTTSTTTTRIKAAPIGSVESLESIQINGSSIGQQSLLWNGDLVRSAAGASTQVLLSSIGKITLRGGAAVKLTTNAATQTLQAQLLNGELQVALNAESSATLEIAGATFVTTKGAQFRAGLRDGHPVAQASAGRVVTLGNFGLLAAEALAAAQQQQTAPRKYLIKPLNLGTNTEIRARSTRNLQVQVTDENDRPVPDAPVLFLLGGGGAGSGGAGGAGSFAGQTSLRATTNTQGIANVNFTAGDTIGSSTRLEVRVEGSEAVWTGTLSVVRAAAGFWSPQNAVPIFSVIGAAVGVGIYKATTRPDIPPEQRIDPRQGTTVIFP
jgi:hypothetical protein